MKRILICLSLLIVISNNCLSQSTELKKAFDIVNTTFKEYVIGMNEFSPTAIVKSSKAYRFKKKSISYEYPNIIIEYKIERFNNGGYNTGVTPGDYKVIIPINSIIEYPAIIRKEGRAVTDRLSIQIRNDDGITKSKDGPKTIITSFILSSDEELTIKKFAKELKDFQKILLSDNYHGKLPTSANSITKNETPIVSNMNSHPNKKTVDLPTQEEISQINKSLPKKVSEGLLLTKVEYDEKIMTQRFYYDYTVHIDESLITKEALDDMKKNMVVALKSGGNNIDRLEAGMTILYFYRSVSKKKLYEIKITSKDL